MSYVTDHFNDEFPLILADNAEELRGNGLKYKIVVENEGQWLIDLSVTPPLVTTTDQWGDAQCELSSQDAEAIIRTPDLANLYYLQGKIKLKGKTPIFSTFYRILQLKRKTSDVI